MENGKLSVRYYKVKMVTHLIHRSKIQSVKVPQSQKWWQNKSVGEPVKQLSFLYSKLVAYSSMMSEIFGQANPF